MGQHAKLLFDSAHMDCVVDARAIVGGERSLLYAADSVSVDMVVYPPEGGLHVVHGQVIDAGIEMPLAGARVRLGSAGQEAETDEHGQFAVSSLDAVEGQVLHVDTGSQDIECGIPLVREESRSA